VDIPQGFHEEGFLSSGITDSIAGLRSENSEWFNLTFDMNSALTRLATEAMGLIRTTLMSPEAIAVRLLLRACGTIQGVILLTGSSLFCVGGMHNRWVSWFGGLANRVVRGDARH
jgi:hypothetical protein